MLCISNNSIKHQSFIYIQLNVKIVLFQSFQVCISMLLKCENFKQFQTIQFSISTQRNSIRLIDRTLLGSTTPSQSGPGSDGNKFPKAPSISPSDYFMSYKGNSLGKCYPSIEIQSVYSAAPATRPLIHVILLLCLSKIHIYIYIYI